MKTHFKYSMYPVSLHSFKASKAPFLEKCFIRVSPIKFCLEELAHGSWWIMNEENTFTCCVSSARFPVCFLSDEKRNKKPLHSIPSNRYEIFRDRVERREEETVDSTHQEILYFLFYFCSGLIQSERFRNSFNGSLPFLLEWPRYRTISLIYFPSCGDILGIWNSIKPKYWPSFDGRPFVPLEEASGGTNKGNPRHPQNALPPTSYRTLRELRPAALFNVRQGAVEVLGDLSQAAATDDGGGGLSRGREEELEGSY